MSSSGRRWVVQVCGSDRDLTTFIEDCWVQAYEVCHEARLAGLSVQAFPVTETGPYERVSLPFSEEAVGCPSEPSTPVWFKGPLSGFGRILGGQG